MVVAWKRKRKSRGLRRPGAGRPPFLKDAVRITVDMERELLDRLDALAERRRGGRAELIRRVLRRFVGLEGAE